MPDRPCRVCDKVARFAVTAVGYPYPMFSACEEHVGHLLAMDASHPGSTEQWEVATCG